MKITEKLGIRVNWIYRASDEIKRKKKSLPFKQQIQTLEAQLVKSKKQHDLMNLESQIFKLMHL